MLRKMLWSEEVCVGGGGGGGDALLIQEPVIYYRPIFFHKVIAITVLLSEHVS